MLDVRIVNVDHYMATPVRGFDPVYSDFRGTSVGQVPVIRIFGTTASGKKTCVHIHGVFPYIYVPFDGESDPSQQMYQLSASLDKALNIALGTANSARQHIYKVVHVKGVPFYGYHEKSHQFLKIYFYNPLIVKKATDLLQNGAVCNKIFQCHEAHLPFILQFFIDYNLHGMSFIQLASVDLRQEPGTLHSNLESDLRPAKTTYCELEADALASDILNRKTISDGEVANPGLAGIWNEERLRNDVSQLSEAQSQERPAAKKTLSEVLLRQRLREALAELSGRITGGSSSSVLYPAESTAGDHVHDASLVEGLCNKCTNHDVSTFMVHLDDSVIDEQLVLSLSQAPADSQDLSLLDVMQSLAERGAEGDEWMPATQKSTEALLSQSFHCANMEADSILGVGPHVADEEEECVPQGGLDDGADETAEKEDCWQDSIWNGLVIPQLDGAPDECPDEDNGTATSTRRCRPTTTKRGSSNPIRQLDSIISNNPSRVSSPIVIDSSEDDTYMACTPMNIFNQERFWCAEKENADSELENLEFEDTIAPNPSLKSDIFDEPLESDMFGEPLKSDMFDEPSDSTNPGNVNPTYANVLMHGDPSLTCLAEASSDDLATANGSNLEKGGLAEAGLNESFNLQLLEESSLSSQDTGMELDDDSEEIVSSSQYILNLDYWHLEEQADEKSEAASEVVSKKKPRKRDKRNVENKSTGKRRKDRARTVEEQNESEGVNANESKPNTGKRKKDQVKEKQVESEGNMLEQDDVELNNNEKKGKQNRKSGNKAGGDKMLARLGDFDASVSFETPKKSKESTNKKMKKDRRSGEKARKNSENGSGDNSEKKGSSSKGNGNEESPSKKQKNIDKECPTASKKQNNVGKGSPTPSKKQKKVNKESPKKKQENEESPSKKQKKGNEESLGKKPKKSQINTSNDVDDDDDDDLFRINFKLNSNRGNDLSPKSANKPKPKSPTKAYPSQAYTTLISTEPPNKTDNNDAKQLFPCYFVKNNGVAMKFKFPLNQNNLSEKTKQRFLDRRKRFASVLLPTVDYNIQLSNIEDGYLTKEMVEEYHVNYNSSEDQCSIGLSDIQNGSPTPKKIRKSVSSSPINFAASTNSTSKPGVESNDNHKEILSPKLSDVKESVANSSVSSQKISKIRKSLDFGLENGVDSVELLQKKPSQKLTNSHELSENDVNTPKKMKSLITSGSSSRKRNTPKKTGKKTILGPVVRKLESPPYKTDKKSMSTPLKRSPSTTTKTSPKSIQSEILEKYIQMYNIKPCRVLMDKSPEKLTVEKTCSKEQNNPNQSKLFPEKFKNSTVKIMCSNEQNSLAQSKLSPEIINYLNEACSKEQNNPVHSKLSTGNFNKSTVKKVCSKKQNNPVQSKLSTGNSNNLSVKPTCSNEQNNPVQSRLSHENSNNLTVKTTRSEEQKNLVSKSPRSSCPMDTIRDLYQNMEYDNLPVPFSEFEVTELKPDMQDVKNLSTLIRDNPIEFKLSVRLDRIDPSMFVKTVEKHESFKIDNLDGSFGEDIDSSSDDDVPITPTARRISGCKKTDQSARRGQSSTPRSRYRPLKVKITKSPPKRFTKPLSPCWVLLKKLDFDNVKGSSVDSVANSSACLGVVPKNPNPVEPSSSQCALSGSDDCDIFGEVPYQPEPKPALNLEGEEEGCVVFREVLSQPEPKNKEVKLGVNSENRNIFGEVFSQKHSNVKLGVDGEGCNIFGELLSQPKPKNKEVGVNSDDSKISGEILSQPQPKLSEVEPGVNSEEGDIFGELLSQPQPKNREVKVRDCKGLESSTKFDLKTEHKSETMISVVNNKLSQNDFENSLEKSGLHNRSASPVAALEAPGPSTSTAPPWCHSDVYDSFSSSDEKEDKGILSFYNTSVYFPKNDGSDSDKTIYEILSLDEECSEVSGEELRTFIPKIAPPTYNEILTSLSKHGLTEVLNVEPFCSDVTDRASTEVGPVSLKLKSRSAIDLEEYDGEFSKGLCMYRNNLLRSLETKKSSVLAGDREVVLVPLKQPPSCEQVRRWLKVKAQLEKETKKEEEKCEQRLIVPCSPGQNCGSDDEQNTLVLTPMSPPSRTHSTPSDCPPGGSLSLEDTPLCTPVPLAPNRRNKRKPSDILKKSSAKLLKDYAAMSSIDENEARKDYNKLQLSDSSICISEETREHIEAQLKKKARLSSSFQIEAGNADSTSGLPTRIDNLQKTRPQIQHQFLTLMILELHVQTRGDLLPDPENDPIRAVFYHIVNDVPEESDMPTTLTGMIAVGDLVAEDQTVSVTGVSDEMALLVALVELIRKWDPEMFIGYEIEKLSWGYLIERAYTLGMNLNMELSRVRGAEGGGGASRYEDEQGGDGDIRLAGRIVLNVWRLLRSEVALQSYTFENIMYHVLRRRIPLFSFRALSAWWEHRTQLYRWMTVDHYLVRVKGVAEILDHLDLIGRTSELARLFGIQFYEVLSRGSQFRVESMMLRMAKPENYVAVSPTTRQRAHMRAPESLPLIMEPESRFYSDPVIVLDFQSLYPSIIIAYNYCFSTCLGRVENLAKSELFDFGCTHLRVPFSTVKKLEENLNFSPCGVAFVNSSVRRGVLPRMLQEILETRLMVKRSMKKNKNNKALHKVLHNRQLGLKLIANVTYGYTSANFSGRMPCIEIGDSVVSKGRETLERAIALVQNTQRWSARVVYGDTDSLFVLVPGRTRADAFRIGAEIADAVTADNPRPVKLKLEKVYQPCILQTKKRYVGHMWESADQEMPTYDAKGIETVRRDGCPAVAKILQKSLQLLFDTKDVSVVKRYILHQFGKVSSGRISIQELTFAREYRGARGYKPGACVPALELARGWMKKDRRSEPRTGERVPYVIVSGPPGLPLIRLVRSPHELLADPALKVNADYYISRVIIPPLNRCLMLVGANVHNWFTSMPRRQAPSLPSALPSGVKKATISQYFATVSCAVCHDQSCTSGVCDRCRERPQTVAVSLAAQLHGWERRRHLVLRVCQSCCGRSNNIDCRSLDCPVLYARADAERQLAHEPVFRKLQQEYFNCDF